MKAIILARVSTEEQKEAGNSLPAQIARIEKYCQQKGFEIAKTYSFDESAYKDKRDEFDKIIDYLKATTEKVAVCFDKVDRLSRNVFDKRVATLYEKAVAGQIELHFVSDGQIINAELSAASKFQFSMSLGLAKYYSDAISDNVKRAFEQKLRKGEWIGQAHIGYINTTDDDDKKTITPDPDKAHYILKIYQLYATGNYSYKLISKEMKKAGLVGRAGKPLSVSMIEAIIKNHFYYGEMEVQGKLYPHNYEPLIPKSLYLKCQKVRETFNKKPFQYAAKPFIFRGLLTCADCGCTITPEIKKGRLIYYSCTNGRGKCKRVYTPEKLLLEPIHDLISQLQLPDEGIEFVVQKLRQTTEAEQEYRNRVINGLREDYDKIQKRVDRLFDEKARRKYYSRNVCQKI